MTAVAARKTPASQRARLRDRPGGAEGQQEGEDRDRAHGVERHGRGAARPGRKRGRARARPPRAERQAPGARGRESSSGPGTAASRGESERRQRPRRRCRRARSAAWARRTRPRPRCRPRARCPRGRARARRRRRSRPASRASRRGDGGLSDAASSPSGRDVMTLSLAAPTRAPRPSKPALDAGPARPVLPRLLAPIAPARVSLLLGLPPPPADPRGPRRSAPRGRARSRVLHDARRRPLRRPALEPSVADLLGSLRAPRPGDTASIASLTAKLERLYYQEADATPDRPGRLPAREGRASRSARAGSGIRGETFVGQHVRVVFAAGRVKSLVGRRRQRRSGPHPRARAARLGLRRGARGSDGRRARRGARRPSWTPCS